MPGTLEFDKAGFALFFYFSLIHIQHRIGTIFVKNQSKAILMACVSPNEMCKHDNDVFPNMISM